MSADGSIIVGESGDSNGPHFATQWTDPTKPKRLPDLGGDGQINVTLQSGQNAGPITAISPNGRWLAAFQAGLWDTQGSLHFDPTDFSTLPSQSWITAVSDPGTALISVNGVLSYQWDEVHGLVKLISLTETGAITGSGEPGSFAQAITPDGQTVVGFSGDRTSSFYATRWTAPDHPEHLPDLGALSAAYSVSADGRVIGGTVHDPNLHPTWGGTALAAVWIDGQLQLLRDAQGNTIEGVVQKVVNGFDGDPFKWIAIGHAAAGNFIAFSGGQTKWLSIWLAENYSLNQGFDDIVAAFIDGNELTIVGRDGTLSARSPFPYTGRELCSTPVYVPPPPGAANRMVTVALHEADFAAPIPANTSSPASGGEGETFASIDSLFALAADHDIRDRLRSISATPTN
jgi:hypothetical protein